jgi:hypothetical protein
VNTKTINKNYPLRHTAKNFKRVSVPSFSQGLFLLTWDGEGTVDAERTKDRQTCRKLGSGVLGAGMVMHNSLVTSFLY